MRVSFLLFLTILLICPNHAFCDEGNKNAWHPDSSIHNIHLAEIHTYYGLPSNTNPENEIKILVNSGFIIGYSEDHKNPLYAAYRFGNLKGDFAESNATERYFERPPRFQIDLRTKSLVNYHDYTRSGYDRGHMAPNYGIRTQYGHLAQLETFLMSNICAQTPTLNQGIWEKVEKKVARELSQDDDGNKTKDLWIISGPIFSGSTKTIGKNKVRVPDAFYKIIVRQKTFRTESAQAIALYFPQIPDDKSKEMQFKTVAEIEELTGLDFFPNLPDKIEKKIESKKLDISFKAVE